MLRVFFLKGVESEAVAEGFDFTLEYINKKVKENLSWAPTNIMWLTSVRMYNFTMNMVKSYMKWLPSLRYYLSVSV